MRIVGIDPGLAIVGWGVIEAEQGRLALVDYGTITTPRHADAETPTDRA